jgi:hypothetical protein
MSLGPFGDPAVSVGVLPSDLGLLRVSVEDSPYLGEPTVPGSLTLVFAFFSFRLAHPDKAFLTTRSPPTQRLGVPDLLLL